MLRNFALLVSFLFLYSIYSQEVYKAGATNIKSSDALIFYSLPQTSVKIKVVCTRTTTYAGPYFAYAEELLGFKGMPSEDKTDWRIDSISLQTYQEPDPEAVYAIRSDKKFNAEKLVNFSKYGLIFDPSSSVLYPELKNIEATNNDTPPIYNVNTIQNFAADAFDTIYKTVIKDTMYVKVPVVKPKTSLKTIREKAKEAADLINRIRERRFELLMSEDDPYAEVNVLKFAESELENVERAYIEMFTGKKIEKSFTFWFQHTPSAKEMNIELFRFSTTNGIVDKSVNNASPVILSYEKEGRTKVLKDWMTSIPENNNLSYRVPDAAVAKLTYKGQVIAYKKILVSQFGTVVPYPVK